MARDFRIKGETSEKKFKYLETILPRLFRKMNPDVVTKLPSSFSSYFKDSVVDKAFNILLFKGKIIKIAYDIESVQTDLDLSDIYIELKFIIVKGDIERVVNIKNRKLSNVIDVGVDVDDGDLVRVINSNSKVNYTNMTFSILYVPDYSTENKESVGDIDEGI
jgi:hypothetical protein